MSRFNDLVGLTYRWGASPEDGSGSTDCFQLVCTVRRRLDLGDWAPRFAWVYESFTEETLRPFRLMRWVVEHGKKSSTPEPGNVVIMSASQAALGVITTEGLMFIASSGQVVHPALPAQITRSFCFD